MSFKRKARRITTRRQARQLGGNYLADIVEAFQERPEAFPPGQVSIALVGHKDGCQRPNNAGPCTCNPDIVMQEVRP